MDKKFGDSMSLSKHTMLQISPGLNIEIRSNENIKLSTGIGSFCGNQNTLAILGIFSKPKTFEKGLEELKVSIKGHRAWIEATSHINFLFQNNILQDKTKQNPVLYSHRSRFDSSPVHIRMLNDRARTESFQRAINEIVTPDDIVVDIGTGTGILALTAAKAGAKHVYAVENSSMAKLTQKIIDKNNLSDKITLIEGRSSDIELPEKANILVSELIGNDPLGEKVLEVTADAVKRLLQPNASLIPDTIKIYGLPVSIPEGILNKHIFTQETIKKWEDWYGVDFLPLSITTQQQNHSLLINTFKARAWPHLADPILLMELDLKNIHFGNIEIKTTAKTLITGVLNGIIIYFDLGLSKTTNLSIDPGKATFDNSWSSKVWIPGNPIPLKAGETFGLSYKYDQAGSSFEVICG